MDCGTIIGIIGTIASIIGAFISIYECREAKRAKDATEVAKEATIAAQMKFFQHLQFERFADFKKDLTRFTQFLVRAKSEKIKDGISETYVVDELEKFLTKFNEVLCNASDKERKELEAKYSSLQAKRNIVRSDDKTTIQILLDAVRELSRTMNDIQMSNKLRVK